MSFLRIASVMAVIAALATATPAGAAVAISAPASKNLGSATTGSTSISSQLGTITVTGSRLVAPSFAGTYTGVITHSVA